MVGWDWIYTTVDRPICCEFQTQLFSIMCRRAWTQWPCFLFLWISENIFLWICETNSVCETMCCWFMIKHCVWNNVLWICNSSGILFLLCQQWNHPVWPFGHEAHSKLKIELVNNWKIPRFFHVLGRSRSISRHEDTDVLGYFVSYNFHSFYFVSLVQMKSNWRARTWKTLILGLFNTLDSLFLIKLLVTIYNICFHSK